MKIYLKIKRKKDSNSPSFFQSFLYEGNPEDSIAYVLNELNSRELLEDIDSNPANQIVWECSCLQKKCGACAMLINGVPHLACSSFLYEFKSGKSTIVLEPLSKFPIIADLKVDRNILFNNMMRMGLWLEENASVNSWEREDHYQSARCLMCGCCLEVCPNFRPECGFTGAPPMAAAYKLIDQSSYGEHRNELIKKYLKFYFNGCGKSLSCQKICPIGLPLEDLLVKSNAWAVWRK